MPDTDITLTEKTLDQLWMIIDTIEDEQARNQGLAILVGTWSRMLQLKEDLEVSTAVQDNLRKQSLAMAQQIQKLHEVIRMMKDEARIDVVRNFQDTHDLTYDQACMVYDMLNGNAWMDGYTKRDVQEFLSWLADYSVERAG